MTKRTLLNMTPSVFKCVLVAGTAIASCVSAAYAQTDQGNGQTRWIHRQGQDIELPEDYMVRVDGNKMQVSLVALGLDSGKLKTSNLLVSLLGPGGEEQTATSNAQGMVEFEVDENNLDDINILEISTPNVHDVVPVIPTSNQVAASRNLTRKSFRLPLMPANREEINASIVRGALPPGNGMGELYASSEYKLRSTNPFAVRLQRDGQLLGRVVVVDRSLAQNLRFAKLTFLRDNQVVARTDSNPIDGSFNVPNLSVGTYGVIASGPAGYSAFSFEVLPPLASELIGEGISGRPISVVQPETDDRLYVFLCPPKFVPRIVERCREVYSAPVGNVAGVQPAPGMSFSGAPGLASAGGFNGGGYGGGGYGGGGGFGGGGIGGLGGIAAVAGLATVAGIVAANDNDDTVTVSPISP